MVKITSYYYKIALAFAVLILILYFAMIFIGENGWQDLNSMKAELKNIKAKNEQIKRENVESYRKIERIKTDPTYMENMARQELKMIGKDEIVFKFDDKNSSKKNASRSGNEALSLKNTEVPQKDAEDSQKNTAESLNKTAALQKDNADTSKSDPDASKPGPDAPKNKTDTPINN